MCKNTCVQRISAIKHVSISIALTLTLGRMSLLSQTYLDSKSKGITTSQTYDSLFLYSFHEEFPSH